MTIGAVAPGFRDTSLSRSKVLKGIKDCRLPACAFFARLVRPLPELRSSDARTCGLRLHWPAAPRFKKSTTIVSVAVTPKVYGRASSWSSCGSRPSLGLEELCKVPESDIVVIPGRQSESLTIRRECHRSKPRGADVQAEPPYSRCHRPESERSVVTDARQERAISGESDRIHGTTVSFQYAA